MVSAYAAFEILDGRAKPRVMAAYALATLAGLYTFYYFVEPERQLQRKVPTFYTDTRMRVRSVRLVFTSPFAGRNRCET